MEQGSRHRRLVAAVLIVLGCALAPAVAHAGTSTLASCTQPNGQPAPTDGWTTGWFNGTQTGGSGDVDTCAQGGSLAAIEASFGNISQGPEWIFTAPPAQTIAGGTSIYAVALCHDPSGSLTCPATNGLNAQVSIHSALIELSDTALPIGSGFSGPLLQPNAHGVAGLLFTAADPTEPTRAVPSPGYGPGI